MRNANTKPRKWQKTKVVAGPVLRRPEAMAYCALRDSQFDNLVYNDPDFPKPMKVSELSRTNVWVRAELDLWLSNQIKKRDAEWAKRPKKEAE
jgi:predicted DNA-binding transcriptional regulator AlpA